MSALTPQSEEDDLIILESPPKRSTAPKRKPGKRPRQDDEDQDDPQDQSGRSKRPTQSTGCRNWYRTVPPKHQTEHAKGGMTDWEEIDRGEIDWNEIENDMDEELLRGWDGPELVVSSHKRPNPLRNPAIVLPWTEIDSWQYGNYCLRPGKIAEITDGSFVHIHKILQNVQTDVVRLRGWELKRCNALGGVLPMKLNEVCLIYKVELDDPRSAEDQSVLEVGLESVLKLRTLIRTNRPFDSRELGQDLRFPTKEENGKDIYDNGRLTLRWKLTITYKDVFNREKKVIYPTYIQRSIKRLTKEECTPGQFKSPDDLRCQWRDETTPGGSNLSRKLDNPAASGPVLLCDDDDFVEIPPQLKSAKCDGNIEKVRRQSDSTVNLGEKRSRHENESVRIVGDQGMGFKSNVPATVTPPSIKTPSKFPVQKYTFGDSCTYHDRSR